MSDKRLELRDDLHMQPIENGHREFRFEYITYSRITIFTAILVDKFMLRRIPPWSLQDIINAQAGCKPNKSISLGFYLMLLSQYIRYGLRQLMSLFRSRA